MSFCGNDFGVASFKGIEFEIQPSDHKGGRRIVTNLYPFSDSHYNEDLGDNPLEWSVKGMFVGDDWRDKLNEAKARWLKGGAGEFFEPTENRIFQATLKEWSFNFDSDALNSVEFSLELIEKGIEPYPTLAFSRFQSSRTLTKYRSAVQEWYRTQSLAFLDLSPAFQGFKNAKGALGRIGRQFLRIGSLFKTLRATNNAKPSRNPVTALESVDSVFVTAIDGAAPIEYFRAATEIRTALPVQSETQGLMFALVALGYYAEKGQDGITFDEMAKFRERANFLKLAANDRGISDQVDNLITSLSGSLINLCVYSGKRHALVASYELVGNISIANEIVTRSLGVSGAEIDGAVYRCELAA